MKKATPKTKRVPLTGTDQLFAILARTLWCRKSDQDATFFLAYRDRARQILNSPHAFNLGIDTLAVSDAVLHGDGIRKGDDNREYARLLDAVIDGDGFEQVEANAEQVRDLMFSAIDEAQLLGAALMFELLGGAR